MDMKVAVGSFLHKILQILAPNGKNGCWGFSQIFLEKILFFSL